MNLVWYRAVQRNLVMSLSLGLARAAQCSFWEGPRLGKQLEVLWSKKFLGQFFQRDPILGLARAQLSKLGLNSLYSSEMKILYYRNEMIWYSKIKKFLIKEMCGFISSFDVIVSSRHFKGFWQFSYLISCVT